MDHCPVLPTQCPCKNELTHNLDSVNSEVFSDHLVDTALCYAQRGPRCCNCKMSVSVCVLHSDTMSKRLSESSKFSLIANSSPSFHSNKTAFRNIEILF